MDRALVKAKRREERAQELTARITSLPDRRFGVILADPPYAFAPWSRKTGMDRAADNHYPTMSLIDIMALPVKEIADQDSALFLWATVPMLPQALIVMNSWGFDYRSHIVWHKDRLGTGYWFRNVHEILLLGIRGKIKAPKPGAQWPSLFNQPRGAHSAKPACVYAMIESYFPKDKKIELFARGKPRKRWTAWGNEVEG